VRRFEKGSPSKGTYRIAKTLEKAPLCWSRIADPMKLSRSKKIKKAPLCKGSWLRVAETEGLFYYHFVGFADRQYYSHNPSEFCCAKPTSLCTREA